MIVAHSPDWNATAGISYPPVPQVPINEKVTSDFEAVQSAGCSNIVAWPLKYLERGQLKAVLGGWDPSDRKFLKPGEITFAVPYEMFARMVKRWQESFLTKDAWKTVRKKIELSCTAWKEPEKSGQG
jgi:hypothetical protein